MKYPDDDETKRRNLMTTFLSIAPMVERDKAMGKLKVDPATQRMLSKHPHVSARAVIAKPVICDPKWESGLIPVIQAPVGGSMRRKG